MRYTSSLEGVTPQHLGGFFQGWPTPPTPQRHLQILHASSNVVLARDDDRTVAGFITALTDGLLAAYIPLLEVRPGWQGQPGETRQRPAGLNCRRPVIGQVSWQRPRSLPCWR